MHGKVANGDVVTDSTSERTYKAMKKQGNLFEGSTGHSTVLAKIHDARQQSGTDL